MKIADMKVPVEIALRNIISKNDDEVYTVSELEKETGINSSTVNYHLFKLGIDNIKVNKHLTYYGNKKAISKLKKKFGVA